MKALIIYCSGKDNNTDRIAQVFARKINCDLIRIKEVRDVNLEGYDLIGIGSGVYMESLSPKIFRLMEDINVKDKKMFVFSTSGAGLKYYNKRLVKQLEAKGALMKGSFACKGSFIAKEFTDNRIFDLIGRLSQGHPNKKDIERAERFIMRITANL